MMPFTRYIVSCLLWVVVSLNAFAQDSLQAEPARDSTTLQPGKKKPLAIILGIDYGKLATTAFHLDTKYEFNVSFVFLNKIRIDGDYGHGALEPSNAIENGNYTSTGDYYRAGIDYMFEIAPKTYLSVGGMYASSSFSDKGNVQIQSGVWPSLNEKFERTNLSAQWAELVLTSEKPIVNRPEGFLSNFYFGLKFRLRFLIEKPEFEPFSVYAIPGFGRTFNKTAPAANLFIAYKLKISR